MRFLRRFLMRLSNFATGRGAVQRLQEEIAEHLAFQTEENMRAGMPPAEARRQAVLRFGARDFFSPEGRSSRRFDCLEGCRELQSLSPWPRD